MENWLLAPPLAFAAYLLLAGLLSALGRALAGPAPAQPARFKRDWYASGEAAPAGPARPGYQPFFLTALFFAVVHLAVLILATGGLAPLVGVYLAGLLLILVTLMLG